MIRFLIIICFVANIVFPIGIKALAIPQSALLLAKSGTGISNSLDINPGLIHSFNPYVSFSKNQWLGDLDGQKISILLKNNTLLSFESLSVDDIELRDEIANDSPIGFFGVYWYAWELNRKLNINYKDISLGYKLKFNFSKLYTETMHGYTIDIGMMKRVNSKIDLGFVIKNFGNESTNSLRAGTIPIFGIGVGYLALNDKLLILTDLLSQDNNSVARFAFETQLPHINFILGSSISNKYQDISFGLKLDYDTWSLAYGNLNHDNTILGNPAIMTIIKYF